MLTRLALRLATVRALRGKTLAGSNVLDSEIGPIEDIAKDKPRPVIIVYTDDGKFSGAGRDLFSPAGDNRVDVGFQHLIIEILLTQRMKMVDDDGREIEGALPPMLDAALAFNLDLIERQVYAALQDASPSAHWAELWRRLSLDIGDRDSQLGVSKRDGVRFAGRQITLSVKLLREPRPGDPIGPVFQRFIELAQAEPDLAPLLPLIEAALAGPVLLDWEAVAGIYGLTRDESNALLLAPPGPPGAAPDA